MAGKWEARGAASSRDVRQAGTGPLTAVPRLWPALGGFGRRSRYRSHWRGRCRHSRAHTSIPSSHADPPSPSPLHSGVGEENIAAPIHGQGERGHGGRYRCVRGAGGGGAGPGWALPLQKNLSVGAFPGRRRRRHSAPAASEVERCAHGRGGAMRAKFRTGERGRGRGAIFPA